MARQRHILMVPYLFQGQINPFVHLAVHLASNGFTVTFINTEFIHHKLTKANPERTDIFAQARSSGLDIHYSLISDGFPLNFERRIDDTRFWDGMLNVFSVHVDNFIGKLVSSDPNVFCLIADTFFVWSSSVAKKYNLTNVSFWTQPSIVFSIYSNLNLLEENGFDPCQGKKEDLIDYIPGIQSIQRKDMPPFLNETSSGKVLYRIIRQSFEDTKDADFVLCNSVYELEELSFNTLQQKQRLIPIGPILPIGPTRSIIFSSLRHEVDVSSWLDKRRPGSVIYLSFGSVIPCSFEEIKEITDGLVLSKANFLWTLHPDTLSYEQARSIFVGFDSKTRNRSRIVPWCSQLDVLSSRAVFGFITNCGWNSVLEAIQYGVPMLCLPQMYDQFATRKLVVEDLKIGHNLFDEPQKSKNEVAEKVNLLRSGVGGSEIRKFMREAKRTVELATRHGGSSNKYLKSFIDYLMLSRRD